MSVFQVKLQNTQQGLLDIDPTTGVAFTTSNQRTIYVAGPNKTYRKLTDGDSFTDCNYWKRFAYPQVSYENAFIVVTSDDGSVYSDIPEENNFAVGETVALTTSFSGNVIDFVTDHGGPARFLQVQNLDSSIKITGQLNADADITFTLAAGETQIFNQNDLAITMLKLKSASGTPSASWIAGIRSVPNS